MADVCIVDPWYSCNGADRPRTVLRLHCDDAATDEFYPQTALVLNFEEDGSDDSAAAQTMQLTGAGAITSTRGRFGALAYENTAAGSTHGLETVATNVLAGVELLALCVEVWVYRTSSGTKQSFFSLSNALDLFIETDGRLGFWRNGALDNVTAAVVPLNTWCCVALQATAKVSGTRQYTLFIDGVAAITGSGGVDFNAAAGSRAAIGKGRYASFIGSIGPARAGTGLRWDITATYRVPAAPFATRLEPALVDTSCAYPKTVTCLGQATTSPERVRFGPRALFVPWRASAQPTINGVQIAPHADFGFGTSDFTLRLWFNRISHGTDGRLFTAEMASGEFSVVLGASSSPLTVNYRGSGGAQSYAGATPQPLNTWRQLLIQRRASVWETYLHGTLVDSRSITGGGAATVAWTGNLWIGRESGSSTRTADCFFDEIDIVAGAALANGNFTVPDLPTCDYGGPNYFAPGARVWPAGIPQ